MLSHFNTSNVTIQLLKSNGGELTKGNFNTSNVTIQLQQ